jgi:hypothetical protein
MATVEIVVNQAQQEQIEQDQEQEVGEEAEGVVEEGAEAVQNRLEVPVGVAEVGESCQAVAAKMQINQQLDVNDEAAGWLPNAETCTIYICKSSERIISCKYLDTSMSSKVSICSLYLSKMSQSLEPPNHHSRLVPQNLINLSHNLIR